MSEQTTTDAPRKVRPRTKRKAAKITKETKPPEFVGLTAEECCADCCLERCVITQKALCGHPRKGGLQPPDLGVPTTLARFQRAVKHLAHARIDREAT